MTLNYPSIAALIFDLDGLLVDSEPIAAAAMERFLASFGAVPSEDIQRQMLGRRLSEAIAISQQGYGLPGSVTELADHYGQMRLDALRGTVQAMPGAREIIAFGRRHGLAIGLATSGMRTHADLSLQETGLAGLFDAEVTGDDVSRGKPAPDLFQLAAERLNVEPGKTVVLEDSPLGVEAGIAAGMRVIAVQGHRMELPEFPEAPTAIVPTLHEAIVWLQARLGSLRGF